MSEIDKRARYFFAQYISIAFFLQLLYKKKISTFNERQLQLTLQPFEKDPQLGIRKAARFYNVLYSTLSYRINGRSTRVHIIVNSRKLTTLEEEMVIRKVFDMDSRGFLPRIRDVENMANRLLAIYDTMYIGLQWTSNFIKRQLELRIRWNRPYNYQRAQCKDLEIIEVWFRLF